MDMRRLMARLNAKGSRMDGAGGGRPEITVEDITGALGYMDDDLAREVFCALWWQEGSKLTRERLLDLIAVKQAVQIDRQAERLRRAKLDFHLAQDRAHARGNKNSADNGAAKYLKNCLDAARRDCWPAEPKRYSTIREAVINEMTSPNHCSACGGRGDVTGGKLVIRCNQCDGTGTKPISDRQRAAAMGISAQTYAQMWRRVYDWTYELVRDAEHRAVRQMRAQLSG